MRAWEEFLAKQEKELGIETVQKWLRPLKIVRFDACNLYLEASDSFKVLWFEEHMRHLVQSNLFNNSHKQIKIHISMTAPQVRAEKEEKKHPQAHLPAPVFQLQFDEIDPAISFESFVSSKGNLLAYKLLCESSGYETVSKKPLVSFNPIYLFGRSGTGKTHLLMATANALKAVGNQVVYVRAETFTEHVVGAIRTGEMQSFRRAYRHIDTFLIDDIEIFARKSATQEELFHTFNTLHTAGKQIILTSNVSPQELKGIEPRLVSRFEWGISIPLQLLDREGVLAVLMKKSQKMKFPLAETVIDFLLTTFNNPKSLTRAFDALVLRTHLSQAGHAALTLAAAKQLLQDLIREEEKATLTPGKIIRTVAEYYGIRSDDILSKSQNRECALPRQLAMHLCREQLKLSYMKIGDIFARDHSTVITSVKQVQKGVDGKNNEIAGPLNTILKRLETIPH